MSQKDDRIKQLEEALTALRDEAKKVASNLYLLDVKIDSSSYGQPPSRLGADIRGKLVDRITEATTILEEKKP